MEEMHEVKINLMMLATKFSITHVQNLENILTKYLFCNVAMYTI